MLMTPHLFPLGYQQREPYHFCAIQTIEYNFHFFKIWRVFLVQITNTKILVTIAPKVVAAWRVVLTLILKEV